MKLNEDAKKIIDESPHKVALEATVAQIYGLLEKQAMQPTQLQWTILINHVNEMIKRSIAGEKMSGVDPVMFEEVSKEALAIADQVVQHIGNLPQDEMYVLSIHFEAARQNDS
ncbi:transcriptional antiterminator [Enterococcus plantarum]|uniref:Transcriptional antiterminator n=1 Tax=Enterococcus plantarum TaxID=1077675 RepID=A0A2W4BPI5_9ENTE|nr:PRD domain-containing protein [Enterococcus plantarum]MBO0422909.1 PRD domain-containing protein [Enterococcus plantarum]MBO0466962.1 PRD domain-containing protein [Enterococcus plantarum]OEG18521.1 transcriptional antiterminator [Enterococcus plantarum]PZL74809.1 transcriptional antiterminator [Enterococcus plantarum]